MTAITLQTTNQMTMHSGRLVTRDTGLPTMEDVALGLSRIVRYGGQTRRPWTVLDHSLLVGELIARDALTRGVNNPDDGERQIMLTLWGFLHDWHECLTSDVPTVFKTDDMRTIQDILDDRLCAHFAEKYNLVFPTELRDSVKPYDIEAYFAETMVLLPKLFLREVTAKNVPEPFFDKLDEWQEIVMALLEASDEGKRHVFLQGLRREGVSW